VDIHVKSVDYGYAYGCEIHIHGNPVVCTLVWEVLIACLGLGFLRLGFFVYLAYYLLTRISLFCNSIGFLSDVCTFLWLSLLVKFIAWGCFS